MNNKRIWASEYQNPKLLTLTDKPNVDLVNFLRWLKKERGVRVGNWRVLDLGSGVGRNANYLAERGCEVVGLEFSTTAIKEAVRRARARGLSIDYLERDIGAPYPSADQHFDLVLDITSSNSLDEAGREIYLQETARVLKPGGWFLVRALCKDGDKNAQTLIKESPGEEKDTYVMPGLKLTERVFTKKDFDDLYQKFFSLEKLTKKTQYTLFNHRQYKRNFWIAYLASRGIF